MATRVRRGGIAQFSINGNAVDLVGDLVYSPGGVTRETMIGMDGIHGYSELPRANFIEATVRDYGDLVVADLNAVTDATISAVLANGKHVIGSNMWLVNAQEVNAREGDFKVRFEGTEDSIVETFGG